MQQLYTFDDLDDLYETAETLPDAEKTGRILAANDDLDESDEYQQLGWRTPIYLEDTAVGDVSSSDDFYHVIQYGDILDAVGTALDQYRDAITPRGHVRLTDTGHRMQAYIDFDGLDAEPRDGDVIDLGLQVGAGHTGFHGVTYDIGAERLVCRNGMTRFISDLHFDQTHRDSLNYGLAQHAVDSVVDGVAVVEDRLARASEESFVNRDEALLVLYDTGIDVFFDEPYDVFTDALNAELADGMDTPTLYDTYNAATRAITHSEEVTGTARDRALEQAATLLDRYGELPAVDDLGRGAVERRVEAYTRGTSDTGAGDEEGVEPYWADEEETLHHLLSVHGAAE